MIEQLGTLLTAVELFRDGITSILNWGGLSKRKDIQRRIVSIQLNLEDIISTAEKIFMLIKDVSETKNQPQIQDIKALAFSQLSSIRKLTIDMMDEEFEKIIKLMAPSFGREIFNYVHPKQERLRTLLRVDDLSTDNLKRLYNESHMSNGMEILDGLKKCSNELSSLIKAKIKLEDVI